MVNDAHKIANYQIRVRGELDKRWVGWLDEMRITTEVKAGKPITVFTGPVIDQVALRGLMIKIWDLNLELISVNRIEDYTDTGGGNPDETDN